MTTPTSPPIDEPPPSVQRTLADERCTTSPEARPEPHMPRYSRTEALRSRAIARGRPQAAGAARDRRALRTRLAVVCRHLRRRRSTQRDDRLCRPSLTGRVRPAPPDPQPGSAPAAAPAAADRAPPTPSCGARSSRTARDRATSACAAAAGSPGLRASRAASCSDACGVGRAGRARASPAKPGCQRSTIERYGAFGLQLAQHADRAERDPVDQQVGRRQVELAAELVGRAARVGDPGGLLPQPGPGEVEVGSRAAAPASAAGSRARASASTSTSRLDEALGPQPVEHLVGLALRAPAGSAGRWARAARRAAGRPRRSR